MTELQHKRIGGTVVFAVADPNDASRTLWVEACVITVGCPHCKSPVGKPCLGSSWSVAQAAFRHTQGTHFLRRYLYRLAKQHDFKVPAEELKAFDARNGCKSPRKIIRPPSIVITPRARDLR